jgi:hypothetical protein
MTACIGPLPLIMGGGPEIYDRPEAVREKSLSPNYIQY